MNHTDVGGGLLSGNAGVRITSANAWRRTARTVGIIGTAIVAAGGGADAVSAATPAPGPPSGIGRGFVSWIAVSPAYAHSGLVAAIASLTDCAKDCLSLWISHDGGSSWHRAAARGWQPSRLTIAVDGNGREALYGSGSSVMRSDDAGETWTPTGTTGMPSVLPSYAIDGAVAVAAAGEQSDQLIRRGTAQTVSGSGSSLVDLQFLPSPRYPSGGTFSPALLVAEDPHSKLPVVLHCDAALACSGGTTLVEPGAASSMTTAGTLLYASEDYADRGAVFANTPVGVQKSTDGGASFAPLQVVSTANAQVTATPMMALAPGYQEHGAVRTAYVAVLQLVGTQKTHTVGGIYASRDGGTSWSAMATTGIFSAGAYSVAVAPDGRLFAGYYDGHNAGLVCSTDDVSWWSSCPAVGDAASGTTAAGRHATNGCAAGCHATPSSAIGGVAGASTPSGQPGVATPVAAPIGAQGATGIAAGGLGLTKWVLTATALVLAIAAGTAALIRRRRAAASRRGEP